MKFKITLVAESDKPISDNARRVVETEADRIVRVLQAALDNLWAICHLARGDISRDELTIAGVELMDEVSE